MDSSSSLSLKNSCTVIKDFGSPKKLKVEERNVWLEDLFVKTPKYTFQTCHDKFDDIITTLRSKDTNPNINVDSFKEMAHILEKLAYHKLFLEPYEDTIDPVTKCILEKTGLIKFNHGEVQFMEGYDQYFATRFISKNISEHCQQVLLHNIFKPENSDVKFFINEIAEQDKNGPLYKMWDNIIYSKIFHSVKAGTDDTSPVKKGNLSDFEIRAAIQNALHKITLERPEDTFSCVRNYLDLCKKHNRLDLKEYESTLSSLLYKLVIADLSSTKVETPHEKLLRYRTFYQSLLLKTVYFAGQTELTRQEMLITSKVKVLIEEVKLKVHLDNIYSPSDKGDDKGMEWLERDGVYLASVLKHLTHEMVLRYMFIFVNLPYEGGHRLIFAERIYTYFIKPFLNSIADEGVPRFDQADFLYLFVPITQYMQDTQQKHISHSYHVTRKELFLTENEWKGLRIWLDNSEDTADFVKSIVVQYDKESKMGNNRISMDIY